MPQQRYDYGDLEVKKPASAYDYGDLETKPPAGQTTTSQSGGLMDSLTQFGKSFLKTANPVPVDLLKSIYQRGNIETLKGIGVTQGEQFIKARESFKKGNYIDASRYTLGWLLPLIGPAANQAGDLLAQGRYAEGLGQTAGLGAQIATPAAISKVRNIRVPGPLRPNLNPVEAAAVQYGEGAGIPIDTATATGSRVARNAQALLQNQIGGEGPAQAMRSAQTQGLTTAAEQLRQEVEPRLGAKAYTPETAGGGVRGALQERVQRFDVKADRAYTELRQLEDASKQPIQVGTQQQPIIQGNTHMGYQTVPVTKDLGFPVDMAPVKQALRPIYERIKETMPDTQQAASPGLKALENIINGDDVVSASTADANLSAIKAIARQADSPQLRNVSQGLAARSVSELDAAVRNAVAQGGKDALKALERGRALTRAKYTSADLLKDLREEPVQVFNQLTQRKDAAVNLLREVNKQAPQEMPKLGRAFLDGLIDTATREGGFGRTAGLSAQWNNLGMGTKMLLFKDPKLIQNLDNFFLLAKRMSENPNPSGTAYVASMLPTAGLVVMAPHVGLPMVIGTRALSKILFSPRGARLLTQGLTMPVSNQAAAIAAGGELLKLAGDDVRPLNPDAGQ